MVERFMLKDGTPGKELRPAAPARPGFHWDGTPLEPFLQWLERERPDSGRLCKDRDA